ncbi:hypothetical protein AL705_04705 [Lawsonella clevelandensis]|uniref:Uncharacterized protein n=1 Tax=Lawsonella clevelandensis TaxID=1528099 RepID=A0A0M5KZL6_9ACTN|nr:hypothetical protein AL705_04705 [Lawsonella clevelandensis]
MFRTKFIHHNLWCILDNSAPSILPMFGGKTQRNVVTQVSDLARLRITVDREFYVTRTRFLIRRGSMPLFMIMKSLYGRFINNSLY